MNIHKAIEILTVMQREQVYLLDPDGGDAVLLGIAALVRIKYQRQKPTVPHRTLLPRETEGADNEPR